MCAIWAAVRRSWQKNWPEVHGAVRNGLPPFVLAARPRPLVGLVPVFWYHVVEPARFEADLAFLDANGYTTLRADELLGFIEGRRALPAKSVVLSFDDGARNLHRVAFPALRRHGKKAVAFIAPAFHDETGADREDRACTWAELREMEASGTVDVQCHTYHHRYVPRWPEPLPLTGIARELFEPRQAGPLSLEEDFRTARVVLSRELDKDVRHLAFPMFDGSAEAVGVGRACGYAAFWWGILPGRPGNFAGGDASRIVRISGEFVRRLPGDGRRPLARVLGERYRRSLLRRRGR